MSCVDTGGEYYSGFGSPGSKIALHHPEKDPLSDLEELLLLLNTMVLISLRELRYF